MKNYLEFIKEAVKISDYRRYHVMTNIEYQKIYKKYFETFSEHDRNYFRIYFDLKINPNKWQIKIPQEIKDYMGWYGYPIIDYNKGICQDEQGRKIRIGKLFHQLGRKDLLKSYEDSKLNTLKDGNYKVVISRHTYDIVGQSTNRGWSTCLDLNDDRYGGKHKHHIDQEIMSGYLVAYLIRENDKNIRHPLSRVIIKKQLWYAEYACDVHVYGAYCEEFLNFVEKWTNKFNIWLKKKH